MEEKQKITTSEKKHYQNQVLNKMEEKQKITTPEKEHYQNQVLNKMEEKQTLKKQEKKKQIKIDYKSPLTLYQFISEGGKISPARITNLKHSQQRQLRNAIKKARRLSLVPSSVRAYDDFGWPEQISAVPFEIE